jgi:uncharacterized protein YndB with AHSA1/START domain
MFATVAATAAETLPTRVEGRAADGTRFYQDSLVIEAPASALWAAFTDTEAYRRWAVPVAQIDFRLGGVIEASYDPTGHLGDPQNIKNAFVAYIPGKLLVFRNVQAPSGLPGGEVYGQTIKLLEFETLAAARTRVTVSGIGFADGAAFDKLYAFFSVGDAKMLSNLQKALENKS